MKGRRRWAALVLWLPAVVAAADAGLDVEALLDELVPPRMAELDVPGVALVVVRGDRVLALRGFGTVDPHAGTPVDPARHVFRIGSVSKPLAATAVLEALRRRGMDAHGDLRAYLARLPLQPPLTQPLTLHHLLTHTAGFNERLFGQHVADPALMTDLTGYLRAHLPPRFIPPGTVIAYNDHHTVLAAWVAERIAGRAFDVLAEDLLLEPLGMAATTFRQVDQPPAVAAHRTAAWFRAGGTWQAYTGDYVLTAPAAGGFSTAADMGRYLEALLACGDGVLDAAVCTAQLARQAGHHPRLPGRAYGFADGRHGALRVLYKDGQASGFNARLLLVPERGLGMFLVHNRNILGRFGAFEPAARFNREITGALLDALLPSRPARAAPPRALADAARRAAGYAGAYRNVVAARHTWERLTGMFDDVHVAATPRGVDVGYGEFVAVAPGLAQWHEGGDHYVAFRQADGATTHLFIASGAYERIPWFTASWFTPWLLAGAAAWFLAWLMLGGRGLEGWARWGTRLPAAAFLAFLGALPLVLATVDTQRLFHGPPPGLLVALALPLVGVAALAVHLVLLVSGWRGSSAPRRLAEGLNVVFAMLFVAWLHYWNLLGYRLG